MFEERFGSGDGEIVTFESSNRAVAIAVTLADQELLTAELSEAAWRGGDMIKRGDPSADSWGQFEVGFEELGKREREVIVGDRRCVSVLHVLRCPSQRIYAIHGIGTEEATEALRADVTAIVMSLTS